MLNRHRSCGANAPLTCAYLTRTSARFFILRVPYRMGISKLLFLSFGGMEICHLAEWKSVIWRNGNLSFGGIEIVTIWYSVNIYVPL